MITTVVNLRREPYDVYIGRPRRGEPEEFSLGNPFVIVSGMTREGVIAQYREYFYDRIERDPIFKRMILACKGKRLGCFCKPAACHGDVIVEYLEG